VGSNWTAAYSAFRAAHRDGRIYGPQEWPLARALAKAETVLNEEIEYQLHDGSTGTLSMSASPVYDKAGEAVAAVATFFDVSERIRSAQALRESEERLRLLLESAHDFAIFMLDLDGRIVSWTGGAETIFGFSEQEVLGQPVALVFTPEDRADGVPEREMRQAFESGRASDERWHLRKDGTRFWASGVLTAARDSEGALRGYVKIVRDQTERRVFERQLQEALAGAERLRATAESANRAKDEFIATVSHELRTPLNTIRLWSSMLAKGNVPAEQAKDGVLMVERAAIAQTQLIDDLLDVSRMANGKIRLALRETELSKAIEDAVESVRPVADGRKVRLESELSPDVGIVRVDPDRIQQVVWNLLTNAVKFTPSGGEVSVTLRRLRDDIEISVRDNGIGIRAELLPLIFERFRQADSSTTRQHGGLGLGLAIASQLVQLHGGIITAESDGEGRGSLFTVRLPNLRRLPKFHWDDPLASQSEAGNLTGFDVLLVEDQQSTREATTLLLQQAGAQVRAVDSAAAAREAFAIRQPKLVIADVGLAGEDGYMLIRALRQMERERNIGRVVAVAVTAFAGLEDRRRAFAAGFDDHVPKPIDPEHFIVVLASLLKGS
jgi:PAS domain S-box-containing protein